MVRGTCETCSGEFRQVVDLPGGVESISVAVCRVCGTLVIYYHDGGFTDIYRPHLVDKVRTLSPQVLVSIGLHEYVYRPAHRSK